MKKSIVTTLVLLAGIPIQAMETGQMSFPEKDWEKTSPENEQVDSCRLNEALQYLEEICGSDGISQVAVIRRGRMIWEGPHIDSRHNVYSCSKSFGSLVAGLLIDEGKLSLDTPFANIMPEYQNLYPDLTIAQALSQTDGFRGEDLQPWIPLESRFKPGEQFHYGKANSLTVLSRIMTKIAGEPISELFKKRIAKPIGLTKGLEWGDWGVIDEFPVNGIRGDSLNGVFTNARQMARIGHLLLNKGCWEGKQLLSAEYIKLATSPQAGLDRPLHKPDQWYKSIHGAYGYLFWVNGIRPDGNRIWPSAPNATFAIQGNRNNVCFVIPDWDMVVVRMGTDKVIDMDLYDRFFALLRSGLTDQ